LEHSQLLKLICLPSYPQSGVKISKSARTGFCAAHPHLQELTGLSPAGNTDVIYGNTWTYFTRSLPEIPRLAYQNPTIPHRKRSKGERQAGQQERDEWSADPYYHPRQRCEKERSGPSEEERASWATPANGIGGKSSSLRPIIPDKEEKVVKTMEVEDFKLVALLIFDSRFCFGSRLLIPFYFPLFSASLTPRLLLSLARFRYCSAGGLALLQASKKKKGKRDEEDDDD
jgi:hypothetical protein